MDRSINRRAVIGGAAAGGLLLSSATAAATRIGASDRAAFEKAIAAGHDVSVKRLRDWIAFPSIAAENRQMQEGAQYMANLAREAGFQKAEVVQTKGHPGVFATLDAGAKKTMAIYFMYDVKQFDPAEWSSPPLEGRIVDRPGMGRIMIGRGAVNQKGPEATFLAALHAMKATGRKLPVNLVLVAEGEEEIGSPHFPEIVERPDILAALKKSVGVIIPTGWQTPSDGSVTINLGAKGIVELELVASGKAWGHGPLEDTHSSNKAIVDSPAWRLVAALSTLVTPDGNTILVPGFADKALPLSPRERELIAMSAATLSEKDMMKSMGVTRWIDDMPFDKALERLAAVPTINIEGLVAGYTGPGGKTVLPGRAAAKIDMRLVPDMTPDDTVAKLRAHLDAHGFADIAIKVSGGYGPTQTPETSSLIKAERATYERFGAKVTLYPRLAGSWPGVVFTGPKVGLPAGQFGLGHGSRQHAPDEYFVIESANPKVAGMDQAALGFIDFLYEVAAVG